MLETLFIRDRYPRYYVGEPPITTIAMPSRSQGAIGFYNNKILTASGYAQSNNPYPTNTELVTLSEDGLSVISTVNKATFDGGGGNGFMLNGKLWYHMGNDGKYNRFLRRRDMNTGLIDFTSSTYTGSGTIRQMIQSLDSNRILVGLGESDTVTLVRDMKIYNISNNTWTNLPSLTGQFIYSYTGGVRNEVDNLIYAGLTLKNTIGIYDSTNHIFSYSPDFTYILRDNVASRLIYDDAMFTLDRFVFFVGQGLRNSSAGNLAIKRYDTVSKDWSIFEFFNLPKRYLSRIFVDKARNRIYINGGSPDNFALPNWDRNGTRYSDMLVFDTEQFLRED